LKQRKTRFISAEISADPDFLEALSEDGSGCRHNNRQAQRKTWQFCRQVQRALTLALADADAGLGGLFVEAVSPAPDCGRLLVHIAAAPGVDLTTALAELRRRAPVLRAEVAHAITRKRAPELTFAPMTDEDGGFDE